MVTIENYSGNCRIVAQPNGSASWHANKMLISALAGVSVVLALFFVSAGLWPLIPFLGFELAAVSTALYLVCWKLQCRHVLRFGNGAMVLEKGHYSPQWRWRVARDAVSLSVELPSHPWDAPKIFLCSTEQQVPVGEFLSKEDSEELLVLLRSQGLRVRNHSALIRLDV